MTDRKTGKGDRQTDIEIHTRDRDEKRRKKRE